MWLKRLLKNHLPKQSSDYGSSPSGGAGSDLGVGSTPLPTGLFGQPFEEQRYNYNQRQERRKRLERQRKWRLSKDRKSHP